MAEPVLTMRLRAVSLRGRSPASLGLEDMPRAGPGLLTPRRSEVRPESLASHKPPVTPAVRQHGERGYRKASRAFSSKLVRVALYAL